MPDPVLKVVEESLCKKKGCDFLLYFFVVRGPDVEMSRQVESWVETVTRILTRDGGANTDAPSRFAQWRRRIRWFYVGDRFQVFNLV